MDDALVLAVRHLKNGNAVEDSTQYLVENFRARLIAYFRHHNFSEADAEDLVQETFRRVLRSIGGLQDEAKFMPWLFQIARNVRLTARAVMIQRQEEDLEAAEEVESTDQSEDPVARTLHREQLQMTLDVVEQLPAQQKQCLMLRAMEEMSYEEIASVLRLSVNTVRNHLREARLSLRKVLGDI